MQSQKILQTTVRFSIWKRDWKRLPKIQGQKIIEQRSDFPFESNIETMDRLAKMHRQKIVETTVRFSVWKWGLKLWIDWLKCTTKTLLKQRLDFPFEKRLKLWIDLLKYTAKKLLKTPLDFPLENKIETINRLAKVHGQKNCWING